MKKTTANLFLVSILFYFAFLSSWYICYSNDFYYPLVYVSADMAGTIQKRADSQQAYKVLAAAGPGQHMGLFRGVLKSVEDGGEGLDKLVLETDGGTYPFLNPAEREKLAGIGVMLDLAKGVFRLMLVLLVLACSYMTVSGVSPYTWRQITRGLSYTFCVLAALFYFLGFDRLYLFFHGSIFGNQSAWFFKNGNGFLSLIAPYPAMYIFISAVFLITLLACWGLYYRVCASVVGYFSKLLPSS
ncbi:DUF1461 domain-containing protein [Seleniivibrio woodruffii]|uniref:Uncharacterized protein DUF1461 n=1 Tax=Seleniivibrio woodruffii TaxID=1078050 RepID=A0A4R1K6C6_9BACT|nr:DUF1461 domain-containing protein [Seleniivibrio woodruffii]TCK59537.1 uncharacterized protein DUF1461 [Seleniivibrio woodruffii]TVZ35422.1 uncharacterized protein DUF1461 [Seleniivibrio woodruffii]